VPLCLTKLTECWFDCTLSNAWIMVDAFEIRANIVKYNRNDNSSPVAYNILTCMCPHLVVKQIMLDTDCNVYINFQNLKLHCIYSVWGISVHVNIPIKQSSFTHPRASFARQDCIKWSNNYRENGMTVNYY